jgi:hypothetical protein
VDEEDADTDHRVLLLTEMQASITNVLGAALGWWLHKLAGGGAITLDHFVEANSVYVAAIVLAAILTLFLKETGSAVREAH